MLKGHSELFLNPSKSNLNNPQPGQVGEYSRFDFYCDKVGVLRSKVHAGLCQQIPKQRHPDDGQGGRKRRQEEGEEAGEKVKTQGARSLGPEAD